MNFAGSKFTAILCFRQLQGGSQQAMGHGQAAILLAQRVNVACSLPCALMQPACMPHGLARQRACTSGQQQAVPRSQPADCLPSRHCLLGTSAWQLICACSQPACATPSPGSTCACPAPRSCAARCEPLDERRTPRSPHAGHVPVIAEHAWMSAAAPGAHRCALPRCPLQQAPARFLMLPVPCSSNRELRLPALHVFMPR